MSTLVITILRKLLTQWYSVSLEQLAHVGIRTKCWKVIKNVNWHEDLHAQVKVGNLLSYHLPIGRGICQGSVMSPSMFNGPSAS